MNSICAVPPLFSCLRWKHVTVLGKWSSASIASHSHSDGTCESHCTPESARRTVNSLRGNHLRECAARRGWKVCGEYVNDAMRRSSGGREFHGARHSSPQNRPLKYLISRERNRTAD